MRWDQAKYWEVIEFQGVFSMYFRKMYVFALCTSRLHDVSASFCLISEPAVKCFKRFLM